MYIFTGQGADVAKKVPTCHAMPDCSMMPLNLVLFSDFIPSLFLLNFNHHKGDFMRAWNVILEELLVLNPNLKSKILNQLHIDRKTLARWISGESKKPKPSIIVELSRIVNNQELTEALQSRFPEAFTRSDVTIVPHLTIPAPFYVEAVRNFVYSPRPLDTMVELVLPQMVRQLDPDDDGLLVVLAQCQPDEHGNITKLYIYHDWAAGTGIWSEDVMSGSLYVSSGSLSASAVALRRPAYWPADTTHSMPAPYVLHPGRVNTAAAFPLVRGNLGTAGTLFLATTHHPPFLKTRRDIIRKYAELFSLAFRDEEFYTLDRMKLHTVPSRAVQDRMTDFFMKKYLEIKEQHPDWSDEAIEAETEETLKRKVCHE